MSFWRNTVNHRFKAITIIVIIIRAVYRWLNADFCNHCDTSRSQIAIDTVVKAVSQLQQEQQKLLCLLQNWLVHWKYQSIHKHHFYELKHKRKRCARDSYETNFELDYSTVVNKHITLKLQLHAFFPFEILP